MWELEPGELEQQRSVSSYWEQGNRQQNCRHADFILKGVPVSGTFACNDLDHILYASFFASLWKKCSNISFWNFEFKLELERKRQNDSLFSGISR